MEMFTWFDLLSIFLILLFGIKGLSSGFIKEVFGLIGLIGGIFLAARFAEPFGTFINEHTFAIKSDSSLYLVGFVALLLLFWAFCVVIGFILSKLVSFTTSAIINKFLGFIVGCLKVFLVFSILTTALSYIGFIKENVLKDQVTKSFMYDAFVKTGKFIIKIDYSEAKERVYEFSHEIKEEFDEIKEDLKVDSDTTNMKIEANVDTDNDSITDNISDADTDSVNDEDN